MVEGKVCFDNGTGKFLRVFGEWDQFEVHIKGRDGVDNMDAVCDRVQPVQAAIEVGQANP
jgi:hypothetical protein